MATCLICDGPDHEGGALKCPTPQRLMVAAMDVEAPPRVPEDETTAFYLSRVLALHGAPGHMVSLAREGHYDDFRSPLDMPEIQLLRDALAAGLEPIAVLVTAGAFDATKAESDAWAASAEGQAVFSQLLEGSRAARRRGRS